MNGNKRDLGEKAKGSMWYHLVTPFGHSLWRGMTPELINQWLGETISGRWFCQKIGHCACLMQNSMISTSAINLGHTPFSNTQIWSSTEFWKWKKGSTWAGKQLRRAGAVFFHNSVLLIKMHTSKIGNTLYTEPFWKGRDVLQLNVHIYFFHVRVLLSHLFFLFWRIRIWKLLFPKLFFLKVRNVANLLSCFRSPTFSANCGARTFFHFQNSVDDCISLLVDCWYPHYQPIPYSKCYINLPRVTLW